MRRATAVKLAFRMQALPEYELELSSEAEACLRPIEDGWWYSRHPAGKDEQSC